MVYLYKCGNKECKAYENVIEVNKPMREVSNEETCNVCSSTLIRVYTAPSVSTSDGFKK